MLINVKSILACLAVLLLFIAALSMVFIYLVSFYKLFAILLLIIGLSQSLARILAKKGEPHYEN
jgi:hypothetical protein